VAFHINELNNSGYFTIYFLVLLKRVGFVKDTLYVVVEGLVKDTLYVVVEGLVKYTLYVVVEGLVKYTLYVVVGF